MKQSKALILILAIGIGATAFTARDKLFEISKNIEVFTKLYKELNADYVDELDPGQLMKIGIDAMLHSLDPYTVFYSENQIERYKFHTAGKYDGIGAEIRMIDDYLTVVEPYEGFAAHEAGLKAGDRIVAVEGRSTVGKTEEEIGSMMRGAAGTEINISVVSYGADEERAVTLTRSEVNQPNVPYYGMVSDDVGYIALTTFTRDAGKNVVRALNSLKQESPGLKGVILDLRDNGGGLLHEAINVSNVFIPSRKEIVFTKGKIRQRDKSYSTRHQPIDTDIPLAVLINDKSASASEIVSGVVQDLDRGVLIGQRSYGKGLVQNVRQLGYNNNLKLTTAKYYIPSGRCIQSVEYQDGEPLDVPDSLRGVFYTQNGRPVLDGGGVTPDILIEKPKTPEVIEALEEESLIFNFVNEYNLSIDTIESAKDFRFSDYSAFKAFVDREDFTYTNSAEKLLEKLQEHPVTGKAESHIEHLRAYLSDEKSQELDTYRDLIIQRIESDLVARFHFQKGKIQQKLDTDPELDEAIDLLRDEKKYGSILKGE